MAAINYATLLSGQEWDDGTERSKVRNLGKILCVFCPYEEYTETLTDESSWVKFRATGKELPKIKERPDINIAPDDSEFTKTGEVELGIPEGVEPIILKVHSYLEELYAHSQDATTETFGGDVITRTKPTEGTFTQMMLDGVMGTLIMRFQRSATVTKIVEIRNCGIKKIAPDGQDNNGASLTEITFQPRGGTAENLPRLIRQTVSASNDD